MTRNGSPAARARRGFSFSAIRFCEAVHGWRKLMPRPHHPKRDLAAQNAFKKTAFLML
jgi:hypothetical protein